MPNQSHYILVPSSDGKPIQHRLRRWLRDNPNNLPARLNTENNTDHIRDILLAQPNWAPHYTANATFVIKPDEHGSCSYADPFIAELEDEQGAESEILEDAYELTFGLERDLQTALRKNIQSLESGSDLKIIDGGCERTTKVGRIDITARDNENRIVVIELKAGEAKDAVFVQVLSYMAAVSEEEKEVVRGIIVASSFSERQKAAAKQIKNLKLIEYSFSFNFTDH